MRARPSLGLVAAVLAAAAVAQVPGEVRWDFQADALLAPPAGFSFARTGKGREGRWAVIEDLSAPAGDHVLAQLEPDPTDLRFPVAVADAPVLKDVRVEVRCKPVGGKTDQACGIVFRYRDADDYYVARANALEGNVNLYKVVKGRRQELQGWRGKVAARAWHALAAEARGDRLVVFWEGKAVVDVRDGTFPGAGRVGVWTKADSVTYFDALVASPLGDPGRP